MNELGKGKGVRIDASEGCGVGQADMEHGDGGNTYENRTSGQDLDEVVSVIL